MIRYLRNTWTRLRLWFYARKLRREVDDFMADAEVRALRALDGKDR